MLRIKDLNESYRGAEIEFLSLGATIRMIYGSSGGLDDIDHNYMLIASSGWGGYPLPKIPAYCEATVKIITPAPIVQPYEPTGFGARVKVDEVRYLLSTRSKLWQSECMVEGSWVHDWAELVKRGQIIILSDGDDD